MAVSRVNAPKPGLSFLSVSRIRKHFVSKNLEKEEEAAYNRPHATAIVSTKCIEASLGYAEDSLSSLFTPSVREEGGLKPGDLVVNSQW